MPNMEIKREHALKKYEADAIAIKNNEDMEFFSPFGPMIAKTTLPAELITRLNHYADETLSDCEDVGREFIVPQEVLSNGGDKSIGDFLYEAAARYIETTEAPNEIRLQLLSVWVVSQYQNSSSPTHFHSSDLSGVVYLKTPNVEENNQKSYISGRKSGYINFFIGGKQKFSKSLISFKPEVGDLYLFPGWLLHCAEPFLGQGERRSMAFNIDINL